MKKGKKRFIFLLVLAGAILYSCKKEYVSRYCDDPPKVLCEMDTTMVNVRVWNKTGYPLCNFRMKYQTSTPDTFRYGTLEIEEASCYVKLTGTKVYPRVFFNLGSGKFEIPDSLTDNSKAYNMMLESSNGFYTFYIFLAGPLDSLLTYPTMVQDAL